MNLTTVLTSVLTEMKRRVSFPVYIYVKHKKFWPRKISTNQGLLINEDYDPKTLDSLGFEILDCYGVEIDGKKVR